MAINFTVQAVRAAWRAGGSVSLLQLDIQDAFDRVHHGALLGTLRGMDLPEWFLSWLQSVLAGRWVSLVIDRTTTLPCPIAAGVPQGSSLSPILFLLFARSLYDCLRSLKGQLTIGCAEDTNVLAFSRERYSRVLILEEAYRIAALWAADRGAAFKPAKSELIHFKRRGLPSDTPVQLGAHVIKPKESARFFGVWLDRRPSFAAHIHIVRGKQETRINALTRLAASTWGCTVPRAREMYTKVVRTCVAFGAGALHNLHRPRFAKALTTAQNTVLCTVLGAYKNTPMRSLELNAFCPPLDIYLNKRVADFERRMQLSGLCRKPDHATAAVARNWKGATGSGLKSGREVLAGISTRGTGQPRPPGTGRHGGKLKAETPPPERIRSGSQRRFKAATSAYTRPWQKLRALLCAKPGRRKSACGHFCFEESFLELSPLFAHAGMAPKPQCTCSPSTRIASPRRCGCLAAGPKKRQIVG